MPTGGRKTDYSDAHGVHAYFEYKERHGEHRSEEEITAAHVEHLRQRAKDSADNVEAIHRRTAHRERSGMRTNGPPAVTGEYARFRLQRRNRR